ncbi:fibronectin type III domain-containing protein, partial [Leucobacter sp. M11]|uniref:fibronectin type III domain-containing protein n=1 Tax=Leucobacter sp. M11 TaxID=2993565 RepID=UPI002D804487
MRTRLITRLAPVLAVVGVLPGLLGAEAPPPEPLAIPDESGKARGSGQYGIIGGTQDWNVDRYGLDLDASGALWVATSGGTAQGITEYPRRQFDPAGGDYLGGGRFAAGGTGYLSAAFDEPRVYRFRDSTRRAPEVGEEPWAEPRGIVALPDGGIAVNDTNGIVNTPVGTVLRYGPQHDGVLSTASYARDQGCQFLADGEAPWGPYVAELDGRLYLPVETCNVVSVFDLATGAPQFRLTGTGQTAGNRPNRPLPEIGWAAGTLDDAYGATVDGSGLLVTDLGDNRGGGGVQRWLPDPETESWALDESFGAGGRISFPGTKIYRAVPNPATGEVYVVPQTGNIMRVSRTGERLGTLNTPGLLTLATRDIAVTEEGWLTMTARGNRSIRLLALSPSPLTGLRAAVDPVTADVALGWDAAVEEIGQAPLLDRVIELSDDGGATWTVVEREASIAATATVRGLAPGDWTARVTPWNEAGRGDADTVGFTVAEPRP